MSVQAGTVAKVQHRQQEAIDLLREGVSLLQDPKVHEQSALEDLIVRAPHVGGLESWLHQKQHFQIGEDLPRYISDISVRQGNDGITVQDADRLNSRFADYQWSQTPKVWDSYLRARRTCSLVNRNVSKSVDPKDVVGPLLASLSKLVCQPEVGECQTREGLCSSVRTLAALSEDCQNIPEELSLWGSFMAMTLPNSDAGRREAERFQAISRLEREVRELCHDLQPKLIAFGLQYRAQYISKLDC
jgi:hypothetical protein